MAEQRALDGKRFQLHIRFGCRELTPGVTPKTAPFRVSYDDKEHTLKLSARPDLTLDKDWISGLAPENVEAIEGFWLTRPWLLQLAARWNGLHSAVQPADTAAGKESSAGDKNPPAEKAAVKSEGVPVVTIHPPPGNC